MSEKKVRLQYFCICDGLQEELYLKRLAALLQTDVRSVTFTAKQGQPGDVLKQRGIKYDKAILFDHDGNVEAFHKALNTCRKAKCMHAYSNLNFDLWLLLHKQDYSAYANNNSAYVTPIRKAYGLGNEADIKNQKVQETILNKIELSDVKAAVLRAKRIRAQKLPSDAQQIGNVIAYDNPDLSIHEFIAKVFDECGENELGSNNELRIEF